jgi:uncharacterized glyoxalase superfamily protein PhnB
MAGANPNPQERHTLTPGLVISDCARAIEFYKAAFGAVEVMRMPAPDGKSIWHAELRFGDSTVYMNDEMPGMSKPAPSPERPSPVTMWLAAQSCDTAYRRAMQAGAQSTMEPADMFWGDRVAGVADPFGYAWSFAEHQKDLTEEEMRRAGEEFAKSWRPGGMQADASPAAG